MMILFHLREIHNQNNFHKIIYFFCFELILNAFDYLAPPGCNMVSKAYFFIIFFSSILKKDLVLKIYLYLYLDFVKDLTSMLLNFDLNYFDQ